MEFISLVIFGGIVFAIWYCCGGNTSSSSSGSRSPSGSSSQSSQKLYPDLSNMDRTTSSNQQASSSIFSFLTGSSAQQTSNSIFDLFGGNSFDAIVDKFTSLDDVRSAIRQAGLESCNLIFGVDYTASNMQQGMSTFQGRSLHHMDYAGHNINPYQRVICILGETLEPFDDDGIIPAFGFGDISTKDRAVFPFRAEGYCQGFHDVLNAYNQITPNVRLSGPTNFAPLINQAIDIVKKTKSYHILVIVADGQVTSERETISAIVEASRWPLSIVMIGVGDGPWDVMHDFDDKLPARKFDNFQFVEFHRIMTTARNPQAAFALQALMEIPDQYKAIKRLGLLNF